MRLVTFIESADHVCYRYRVAAYAEALAARGWTIEPIPLARNAFQRIEQLRSVRHADAVLIQRRLLAAWQLALLRRSAKVLLFDFDDAIYLRDSNSRKPPRSLGRMWAFYWMMRAVDGVSAGNPVLAAEARGYLDPARVTLLPTTVDPQRYPTAAHGDPTRRRRGLRIAWIGSRSTMQSLHDAQRGLQLAAERLPAMQLHVICDDAPVIPGVAVVRRPWSSATEAADLADCDVGLSWLPRHPWSEGKCGLKVLQYQAAGLPVVANRFGEHERMIRDNREGLLCDSPEHLAQALERLADDCALRGALGRAARKHVERQFSTQVWGEQFAAWVDDTWRRCLGHPRVAAQPQKPSTATVSSQVFDREAA